jgi:hypothetical protein
MEHDMTDRRRMTINPPLTEAEFARFCAVNPDLEIDRDPSGVIVMSRKRKCRDDYGDWLLSQRGTISSDTDLDDDSPRVGTEIPRIAEDTENLQELDALRDRLGDGAWSKDEQSGEMFWSGSIGIAQVRIVDGLIGLWLQVDQTEPISVFDRLTEGCDWPKIEGLDDFELGPVHVVSVRLRELFRPFVIYLSERDYELVLELLEKPPAPNEKLKEAVRSYQGAIADFRTSDTKSISEIVDTE